MFRFCSLCRGVMQQRARAPHELTPLFPTMHRNWLVCAVRGAEAARAWEAAPHDLSILSREVEKYRLPTRREYSDGYGQLFTPVQTPLFNFWCQNIDLNPEALCGAFSSVSGEPFVVVPHLLHPLCTARRSGPLLLNRTHSMARSTCTH